MLNPQLVAAAARNGSFAMHSAFGQQDGAFLTQQSAGQTGMALADPDPQVPAPPPKKEGKILGMERKTATMVGVGLVALAGVLYFRGQA